MLKDIDITVICSIILLEIILLLVNMCEALPSHWCPMGRYPTQNGKCKLCYAFCSREGCTGSGRHLGTGGCTSCWLGKEVGQNRIECLSPFSNCPAGYYRRMVELNGHSIPVCHQCHSLCRTCSGPGVSFCDTCTYLEMDGVCVRACPLGSVIRGRRRKCVLFGGYSRQRPFYLLPYRDRYRHRA